MNMEITQNQYRLNFTAKKSMERQIDINSIN